MGSSSRYVKSAGSPLAPPTPTGPRGPSSSHPNQPGALQLIAKWQNPKTNILIALLGWDVPHSTVQACGRHRDVFLPVKPGQCSKGARGTVLSQDTGGTMRDHVPVMALQKGDFGLYIPPVKGGQQETGQPISPVLSSRARAEGWGQQPAALDEEPGVPACSSVTLTPSCLGSAQPRLLEKDPGTLAWQTPAWGAPVGQVTSLDTSNLCTHCRRKTDLGRRRSGVGRQA